MKNSFSLFQMGKSFPKCSFKIARMATSWRGPRWKAGFSLTSPLAARRAPEEDPRVVAGQHQDHGEDGLGRLKEKSFSSRVDLSQKPQLHIGQMGPIKSFCDFMLSGMKEPCPRLIRMARRDPFPTKQHRPIFDALREHDQDFACGATSACRDHHGT